MKTRKQDMPTIAVQNIAHYINSKRDMINRHFVIMPDGSEHYLLNGKLIPAEMMDDQPPQLQKKAIFKGNGLDGRTNWIQ